MNTCKISYQFYIWIMIFKNSILKFQTQFSSEPSTNTRKMWLMSNVNPANEYEASSRVREVFLRLLYWRYTNFLLRVDRLWYLVENWIYLELPFYLQNRSNTTFTYNVWTQTYLFKSLMHISIGFPTEPKYSRSKLFLL